VLTALSIIQNPIRFFPLFFGQLVEFIIAMRRVQNFLNCEEINHTVINDNSEPNMIQDALVIKNGNFHWGYLDPAEAHKKVLAARKGPPGKPV